MSFVLKRQQLVKPINDYLHDARFSSGDDSSSTLILDGTGPRITVQLPYLNGLGLNTLNSFDRVIGFSGGIGAYCSFLAQNLGCLNHPLEHYFGSLDMQARLSHRDASSSFFGILNRYWQKKPLYSRLCYMDFFRYVFKEEFLRASLNDIAPNFIPYVAFTNLVRPVAVTNSNGFDRDKITLSDVMSAGMKIPHIYSEAKSSVQSATLINAYDATYSSGYWSVRLRESAQDSIAVVLTMSSKNLSDKALVVNTLKGKKPIYSVSYDIFKLIFNLPNSRYRQDLHLAYMD